MSQQKGFTLIEVALVLLVIGLMLGGILKGQALIENARVRALANQIHNVNAAWFAFIDRYRALPGDLATASTQLDTTLQNGDGNGRVNSAAEVALVWQHLAAGGFISGTFDGAADNAGGLADTECTTSTCPTNPFGGFMKISSDADGEGVLHLITGANVPPSALMQLDLQIDDGNPDTGAFVAYPATADCASDGAWSIEADAASCSGAWIGF